MNDILIYNKLPTYMAYNLIISIKLDGFSLWASIGNY